MRRPSQCGVGQGGTNSTQLEQITTQERKLRGVANTPFCPSPITASLTADTCDKRVIYKR